MIRLSMSSVRDHLKLIYETSVLAVKPNSLIKNFIQFNGNHLLVKSFAERADKQISLQNRDIYVLGAGKAVLNMCEEFLNQFHVFDTTANNANCVIKKGLLSVPTGATTSSSLFQKYNVKYMSGAVHNMPDDRSRDTTQEILDLIKSIKKSRKSETRDKIPLIVSFISGGGSALLTLPKPGLTVEHKCQLISELVKSGATIDQLNTVRQCLSQVKSGKLAKLVVKGPDSLEMVSFIISDIIDDPIELIASGPTVLNKTDSTKPSKKAFQVIKQLGVEVSDDIKNMILSEDQEFNDFREFDSNLLHNIVIGNNSLALKVAKDTAEEFGYKVIFLGNDIRGEASLVAQEWAQFAIKYEANEEEMKKYRGICWLAGGETTVNMMDSKIGMGGRCQEMGLAFYRSVYGKNLPQKLFLLCAGTDGQDGPTEAAGVVVESVSPSTESSDAFTQSAIDLQNHNSYNFFVNHYKEWLIITGISGTNVMDIYCMIRCF